jgi:hypothetical protein
VSDAGNDRPFPAGLLRWAGNKSGGARRLFDVESGRPSGPVLPTSLLARLERWTGEFSKPNSVAPRLLFLVGGPGNGKTEAIESTIEWLDRSLGCDGNLVAQLSAEFAPIRLLASRERAAKGRAERTTPSMSCRTRPFLAACSQDGSRFSYWSTNLQARRPQARQVHISVVSTEECLTMRLSMRSTRG